MCQILACSESNPPKQALVDGNDMNKDGFGYAWLQDKQVHWNKGFSHDELTDEVIEDFFSKPFPKAIHFRLATHGGTTQALTHPFPIKRGNPHDLKGTAKAVLFHNGVWHAYDDRLREAILAGTLNPNVLRGGMSDSRAMAVLVQRFGIDFLDLCNLGSNKVHIITSEGTTTWGSWTEKEGWSASNSRIFRVVERPASQGQQREVHKGIALGPSGLALTPEQRAELGRKGHLNRHGNVRQRFRDGLSAVAERDVDQADGQVDAAGKPAHRLTEQPQQRSLYLSATMDELHEMQEAWGRMQ